jgi:hypothetical protein
VFLPWYASILLASQQSDLSTSNLTLGWIGHVAVRCQKFYLLRCYIIVRSYSFPYCCCYHTQSLLPIYNPLSLQLITHCSTSLYFQHYCTNENSYPHSTMFLNVASPIALASTRVYQEGDRKLYGTAKSDAWRYRAPVVSFQ